jgi:hypothetical protein
LKVALYTINLIALKIISSFIQSVKTCKFIKEPERSISYAKVNIIILLI